MRRFLLVFLGALLLNTYAFAQLSSSIQTGKASQELKGGGLIAAHFNIPLGSRVKVANVETGKEIEVTIRGRIPLSPSRIIDLSSSAWNALELTADTEVRVTPPPSLANRPPAGYAAQETEPPAVQGAPAAPPPQAIDETPPWDETSWDAGPSLDEGPSMDGREDAAMAAIDEDYEELADLVLADDEEYEYEEPGYAEPAAPQRPAQPQKPAAARQPIKVIPGLPNPNARKFYRLQVGAFSVAANADEYERRAKALGFAVERERYGALTRVVIVGIKASDVKLATQELEAAGFTEVWVRE